MFQILFTIIIISFSQHALSQTCPPGKIRVRTFPRSDFHKKDGTYYSASQVTSFCRTKSKAHVFWTDKLSNGRIDGWPNHKETFKNWSASDMELVLDALDKVPEFLWKDVKIFRATISTAHHLNAGTSAKHVMVIYDEAIKNKNLLPRVITHELAHQVFREFSDSQLIAYKLVANWGTALNHKGDKVLRSSRKKFVAPDGDLSPDEDFANNVEYFIFDKNELALKAPRIMEWLDIEYGDKIRRGRGDIK